MSAKKLPPGTGSCWSCKTFKLRHYPKSSKRSIHQIGNSWILSAKCTTCRRCLFRDLEAHRRRFWQTILVINLRSLEESIKDCLQPAMSELVNAVKSLKGPVRELVQATSQLKTEARICARLGDRLFKPKDYMF